jgi:CubicO group peptidase (beta-lactamase class C family)
MRVTVLLLLLVNLSSCWLIRAYRIRTLKLTDHKKLPSVVIQKPDTSWHFIDGASQPQYMQLKDYLDSNLAGTQTAAFLVIRNDSIIYEKYFDGFNKDVILPSNSMAKSFTGTLVRIAQNEGKIKSLAEPMTNYVPELLERDTNFKKITIQHLLDMRSGFDFNEGRYDLRDDAIRIGLSPNLKKQLLKIKIAEPPGRFRYQSINTQFLGMIIERATGKKLSAYLEEKIWKPLGAEHDATWNVDSKKRKREFASAGLNAIPRDFAKLGRLYLNKGEWNGKQVIDEQWVNAVSSRDTMEKYGGYKNQWWSRTVARSFLDSISAVKFMQRLTYHSSLRKMQDGTFRVNYRTPAFTAIGFLNQYLYVHPAKKLLIIRIGRRWRHSVYSTQFIHQLGERL